jgi:hypothetical protein
MSLRLQTAIASLVLLPSLAFAGINWNDKAVKWHGYDDGVAAAKRDNKPILLVGRYCWSCTPTGAACARNIRPCSPIRQ